MLDWIARLLAKLCPQGVSAGTGGGTSWDAMEVAACMAGCSDEAYIAILSKYCEDKQSRETLLGLLQGHFRKEYEKRGVPHPLGPSVASRLSAELVWLQYLDGYKCHHCGNKGEIWPKGSKVAIICPNCHGNPRGCFSDAFRRHYLQVQDLTPYAPHLNDGEVLVNGWETQGGIHLKEKARHVEYE